MRIQLIRGATLRFSYAGRNFIIDPCFSAKHTMPSWAGKSLNPLVDLGCSPLEVIEGIEMAIISHLHSDHFDSVARKLLPKEMLVFCQPSDEPGIRNKGFYNVTPIENEISWNGITITRFPGQHGTGEVLKEMGNVAGFVFQAEAEPAIYWTGDTIWCNVVKDVIKRTQPKIIVTHSCGAVWRNSTPIVMDATQTIDLCHSAPKSTVIATHMDSFDHATVSREFLREYANANCCCSQVLSLPCPRHLPKPAHIFCRITA